MKKLLEKMFGYRVIRDASDQSITIKKGLSRQGTLSGGTYWQMSDEQLIKEFLKEE